MYSCHHTHVCGQSLVKVDGSSITLSTYTNEALLQTRRAYNSWFRLLLILLARPIVVSSGAMHQRRRNAANEGPTSVMDQPWSAGRNCPCRSAFSPITAYDSAKTEKGGRGLHWATTTRHCRAQHDQDLVKRSSTVISLTRAYTSSRYQKPVYLLTLMTAVLELTRRGTYPYETCLNVHPAETGWFPYMLSELCCIHSMMFSSELSWIQERMVGQQAVKQLFTSHRR